MLSSMQPHELKDLGLVRDVLSGYLPPVWVSALCASSSLSAKPLDLDVLELVRDYAPKGPHAARLRAWKEAGDVDRIDELVARLATILSGPECGVLIGKRGLSLTSLEALFADLPGDQREKLQEALGQNPTAIPLLDLGPTDVLTNYGGSAAHKRVEEWKGQPVKRHRVALLVTAVRNHVLAPSHAAELRKSNAQRTSIGHFLLQVGERWGVPLAEALHKISVTPIRPPA
jgi:hypothetical protein